jgi:imidazolonepropionase-like amidohydrolase
MTGKKYIFAGWLIDGSGKEVQKRVCLVVEEGKITSTGSIEDFANIDPSLVTDLSHCTLLPPLIDCNVNLCSSAAVDKKRRKSQALAGFDEISLLISQHVHFCQSHGVLGVADGGSARDYVLRYRDNTIGSNGETIAIKTSAPVSHNESCSNHNDESLGSTPSTISADIDRYDYIKIMNSEEVHHNMPAASFSSYFEDDELDTIVRLADQKGKKVIALANGERAVKAALKSGCHAIEQGSFMGEENLKRMAASGVVWIPAFLSIKSGLENFTTMSQDGVTKIIKQQLEQLSQARAFGVKAALGTGAGSSGIIHGESVVEELKYFIKGGYSLVEAIRCVSANGAELLDISEMGLLQEGRAATFIVSRGMPAQLPRKLTYLEAIYINGEPSKVYRKNPIKKVSQWSRNP